MIRAVPLALVVLLAACATDEDGDGQGSPAPGDQGVAVTLTEHEIEISGDALAGEVIFELSNEGDQAHGFVIAGNGIDQTLTTDVRPGAVERVSIDLEPGTYTVWCPIGDHRERGMEAQVEVREPGGS